MKLSIVIRIRNQKTELQRLIRILDEQINHPGYELIIVDNHSTDGIKELKLSHDAKFIDIYEHEFSYGKALNKGLSECNGEVVLLLSPHVVPLGVTFLEQAIKPFEYNSNLAAVRCVCVNNPYDVERWHETKLIRFPLKAEQDKFETGKEWLKYYPSASCCVIRRSVWEEIHFDEELEYSEDKQWASKILQRGYSILSCAQAFFYYAKKRSPLHERDRQLREYLALYRINGYRPVTTKTFFSETIKIILLAPFNAIREVRDRISQNYKLWTIPARISKVNRGSLEEYSIEVSKNCKKVL